MTDLFFLWMTAFSLFGSNGFVVGGIQAELGNNLFQVATACALAWDHGAEVYFPELIFPYNPPCNAHHIPLNYNYLFFRCNVTDPGPVSSDWNEPSFAYHPIPFRPNMRIAGYFQSEKYFSHHRERILELFAPHGDVMRYIEENYGWLLAHPNTVGVQIRDFEGNDTHIQYGKEYLRKAALLFPNEPLFVVSSNHMQFAKKQIPPEMKNVFFLENEPHYIDFYLLSFCQNNIITNSTFGWWSAWLNRNENKKVVAPKVWFYPSASIPSSDIVPETWVQIEALPSLIASD